MLPTAIEIERHLHKLVHREVSCAAKPPKSPIKPVAAGLYHGGDGRVIAACAADLPLAACLGACLSIMPSEVAQDAIRAGRLDEILAENFAEVLNVVSRLFTRPLDGRVALLKAIVDPAAVPGELAPLATGTKQALFSVEIEGYGSGMFSLWAVA